LKKKFGLPACPDHSTRNKRGYINAPQNLSDTNKLKRIRPKAQANHTTTAAANPEIIEAYHAGRWSLSIYNSHYWQHRRRRAFPGKKGNTTHSH